MIERLRCGRAHTGGPAGVQNALLGKARRYAPDRVFDTTHVFLDLDVDFRRRSVSGLCRTTIKTFAGGAKTLTFDAVDLKVTRATVDGAPARFKLADGKLVVTPARALEPNAEAEVEVRYSATDPKSGLHFVKDPVQVWSQSQPEDARFWYPCHDSPHEKCTSEVRCSVPEGFRVISNGSLVEQGRRDGKAVWHWRMDRPHSIYLISIAVGRFSEIEQRWQDVPVTFYCEKGREQDALRGFGKTVKAMEFFSKVTGVPYPYDKYAQVAVAEYPGGMEHTTCTTQTDACLIDERAFLDVDLDLLVAHELAHQWFGDLVTCRDWSHAWLNEGFATYFEVLFQEHDKGRDEAEYELFHNARAYFDEDARRYRRPIVTQAYKYPWTIFDRHLYEKGCWVLHMLRRELGAEDFGRVIKHYLETHRDGSVETLDLIEAIAAVTGRNLRPFFDQWVFRGGYPVLKAVYRYDEKGRKVRLQVVQSQDVSEDSPAFKLRLPVKVTGRGWTRDFVADLSEKEQVFTWSVPGEPVGVEVDPEFSVLAKLTVKKPQALWLHQLRSAERAQKRHEAAAEAARWTDDATAAALEAQIRREPFWGAACEMVRALGGMRTDAAFAALGRLARHKDSKVRRVVVEQLAGYRRPETPALLAPLAKKDPSVLVEAEALRALGALRAREAEPLLRAALSKDSYRDVVGAAAVGGLAARRDPRLLEQLRKLSRPPHSFTRRSAALRALSDYAAISDRAVGWISEAVSDEDERIALVALAVLGGMDDERALPAVESAKKSPNQRVRVYAEEAAARIRAGLDPKPPK